MGSNQKQTQTAIREKLEQKLKDRLAYLSGKGIEAPKVGKDTIVKKLRADIKAVNIRLNTIAAHKMKTEELAKVKAEKAAVPAKEVVESKGKKTKAAPAQSKEKSKKDASPVNKEKKEKKEKKG